MTRPSIAVARAMFAKVIERLQSHFDVLTNQSDEVLEPAQLITMLKGCSGLSCAGSELMDSALLDAATALTALNPQAARAS